MERETRRLYFDDPYRLEFQAEVLSVKALDAVPGLLEVVLAETCFYPTGGGQPHDLGVLGGKAIRDVQSRAGQVIHLLADARPEDFGVGQVVAGVVDGERRADYRAQHHAQHVLSAAAFRLFERETLAVRLASEVCTVDLSGQLTSAEVYAIEDKAMNIAREGREVRVHYVDERDVETFGLRRETKVQGVVRVIEVEGFDRAACGGTHPRTTAEIAPVKVTFAERVRGESDATSFPRRQAG